MRIKSIYWNFGQNKPEKSFRYIDTSSIDRKKNIINYKNLQYLSPEQAPSRARKLVSQNSVLFSTVRPYLKNIAVVRELKEYLIASTAFIVLDTLLNETYLKYYLLSDNFINRVNNKSTGTSYPAINDYNFNLLLIALPPLSEQQRIVEAIESALEKVDEYAESYNRLEQLDKEFPDKLKKSILQYAMQGKLVEQDPNDESVEVLLEKIRAEKQKLFEEGKIKKKDLEISIVSKGDDNSYYGKLPMNWVQTTLNYIGIISTGNTPSKNSPENYGGEIPFYKPADLLQGELYNATEYLSVLGNTKSRKIKAGSILINGIGNIGIAGIVRVDGAFNQQMHGIEVFNFVNSKFLLLAIQSDFMQKQFKNNTSSTTIPILNKTRFSQTIINFPGIRTQKLIITKAEKLFEKVSQFPE
ncbi:TPA: restriction endonuclease subunit S [Streptococcus pneumoniae]|nr:type I restriction-modification system M protein [Streptococcus pneumoniae]COK45165.1 type I restriction-modification system M protein [Streptococcus pneumoniae]HET2080117.1 restriction endonuclease subunit S [Streptococcus pneumoniae]